MDVWQWLHDYERWAYREGSAQHRQLLTHYYQGSVYLRAQATEKAFAEFTAGLHLAGILKKPCWELFFKFWRLETRTYYQSNIAAGLDLGIRATTQAHQEHHKHCPGRAQIFFAMAEIYSFMDAVGYENDIQQLIDYILNDTHPDEDTRQRIVYLQACVAYEFDDLKQAEDLIADYMNQVQGQVFRETFYYTHMRRIAFAHGNIPAAFDYAQEAVRCARWSQIVPVEGWNRIWSAALAHRMGNDALAGQFYRAAVAHYATHHLTKSVEFYDAACDYHEQRRASEQALVLREEQASAMAAIGSVQYQCHGALQTARLLGRMGRDSAAALTQARELATGLKKPQRFLAKVQRVADGYYTQYPWQLPL